MKDETREKLPIETHQRRLERAHKWANEYEQRTGEGPGRSFYMQSFMAGYFNHPMTSARSIDGIIIEEFADLLRRIDTLESAVQSARNEAYEKAALIADGEGKADGNIVRWDACNNVAREVRALKTDGTK